MHKFGFVASSSSSSSSSPASHCFDAGSSPAMQRLSDPEQEDDFVAGLVEQMAHSMLDDGEEEEQEALRQAEDYRESRRWLAPPAQDFCTERRNGWNSSTNTNSPSPAVSPPTPLHHFPYDSSSQNNNDGAWELLHMAAQEVMRLKMGTAMPMSQQQQQQQQHQEIRAAYRHGSQAEIPNPALYSDLSAASARSKPSAPFGQHEWKQRTGTLQKHHSCYQNQAALPVSWSRRPSRAFQQIQTRQVSGSRNLTSNVASSSSSSSSCHHHRPSSTIASGSLATTSHCWNSSNVNNSSSNNSGMRAVFLRGPGFGSSTSNGTGVFLPQASPTATTSSNNRDSQRRNKPSCSTVLLPSRIVEVLNLNVDDLHCHPGHGSTQMHHTSNNNHNNNINNNNNYDNGVQSPSLNDDEYLSVHLAKSYSTCSPTRWHSTAEHALPTEWTY